jgi:hypothetical protein
MVVPAVIALAGCGIDRPDPLTVEPDFSHREVNANTEQASAWPVPGSNLAEATNQEQD